MTSELQHHVVGKARAGLALGLAPPAVPGNVLHPTPPPTSVCCIILLGGEFPSYSIAMTLPTYPLSCQ